MTRIRTGVTFFIGGARSGKSDLVVKLGESWDSQVVFVATATAGDTDMAERIRRHQLDRPDHWGLVEHATFGADELREIEADALVIVDCITLLVSNLFFNERSDDEIVEHAAALVEAAHDRPGPTLVVTNEVGLGLHPETQMGRRYRDLLGKVNRRVADLADTSLFVVAGRALELKEIETTW
jgi:adenosyl cobinamide kinase/adenosyl cobinamide phosphate guanylyltransferase